MLGTAQLTVSYGALAVRHLATDEAEAIAVLRSAAELGVAAIDTSPTYGAAEDAIGLVSLDTPVHTKFVVGIDPVESLYASLRRLRRKSVDVAYFHDPQAAIREAALITRVHNEAKSLVYERLGISVYDESEFEAGVENPHISVIQAPISVLDRRFAREWIALASHHEVDVYARSVLLQGVIATPADKLPNSLAALRGSVHAVQQLAASNGLQPLELAIAWVCSIPGLAGVVIGVNNRHELTQCVEAARSIELSQAVLDAVEDLPLPPVELVDPRRWPLTAMI